MEEKIFVFEQILMFFIRKMTIKTVSQQLCFFLCSRPFFFLYIIFYFLSARSFSQTFKPSNLPGLKIWFTSDSGVVLVNNSVVVWEDISINGNNASQSNAARQPLFIDSLPLLNHKPVIRFDGVNDFMQFNLVDIRTIFLLVKHRTGFGFNAYYNAIMGNSFSYHWHGNPDSLLFRSYPQLANILNGQGFVNGVAISPLNIKKPVQYSILTLITAGNHPAERITGDDPSNNATPYWDGDYVEIIIYDTVLTSMQRQQVELYLSNKYAPSVNLGGDITVGYGFCPISIDAGKPWLHSYQWSTGDTTDSIVVNKPGNYSVSVLNTFNFPSSDTIKVTYPGNFTPFSDTTICFGDTLIWNTQLNKSGYTFQWQDGSTDSLFYITEAGQYYVVVTDSFGCTRVSDTITIAVDSFSQVAFLGMDTAVCSRASISLVSGASQAVSYVWQPGGQTTSAIVVTAPGTYSVTVANGNGCIAMDSITISIKSMNPVVNFSSTTVCFPNATQFTDLTLPNSPDSSASWIWDFGDGSSFSSQQHPVHSYSVAGTYTVTLTVITDSGCVASGQFPVIVNAKPNADFTWGPFIACSGKPISFSDNSFISSGDISGWYWNFGDGTSAADTSVLENDSYTYLLPGIYTVTLITTSDAGCKDTVFKTVNVQQSPIVSFTADTVCVNMPTTFNGIHSPPTLPILSWQWDIFGNGTLILPGNTIQYTYPASGTYTVILTAMANNGCINSDTGLVMVNHLPTIIFFPDSVCKNSACQFYDSSFVTGSVITSWLWDFGDGSPVSSATNPVHTYTSSGTHSVTLTLTSAQGCVAAHTQTIAVMPLPVPAFSVSPSFISPLDTVYFTNLSLGATSYSWNFGDGSPLNASVNPIHVYSGVGTYTVNLTCYSSFGCAASYSDEMLVAYPLLDLGITFVNGVTSSGTVQVYAYLKNFGTLNIENFRLFTWLDNGTSVYESWTGTPLVPNGTKTYIFNSQLGQADEHSTVCVGVAEVNGRIDDVVSNNKKCSAITNELTLLDPFPNPTSGEISFFFVCPEIADVTLEIYDAKGKAVEKFLVKQAAKGLNQVFYNTVKIGKGIYALRLTYKDHVITRKFMKE